MGDLTWKIMIGGEGGVGKTTILHRYIHNEFTASTLMTVGVQFHIQRLERQGKSITLSLWDLGGQERFRFVFPQYCRGAVGGFVLFDMSRFETFAKIGEWVSLFKEHSVDGAPVLLVGTKYDVASEEEREMMHAAGEEAARKHGCVAYISTSAKYGINVVEAVNYMVDYLLYRQQPG